MNLFKKKKYIKIKSPGSESVIGVDDPVVPDGSWIKCKKCKKIIYQKEIGELKICPECGGHFRLSAWERIISIADAETFLEINSSLESKNPMGYEGYEKIIANNQEKFGIKDSVITGRCKVSGSECVICVMDSNFMMGSMGSVVGEKITRAIEVSTVERLPLIIFTTSGGARMQEGIISLMQMAKISSAIARHNEEGLLYISVLTDPTTGGVTASFAMLGDIIISEPDALVGFAGQRVIKQTIGEDLPKGFQTAEFQFEHGFIDIIINRYELKDTLGHIIKLHIDEERGDFNE